MPLSPSDVLRCWLLDDRNDYQTCHIRLPDGESLSAVAVNNIYYGFRRRLASHTQTLKILKTISAPNAPNRITDVALTFNPNGNCFLWAREENALPKRKLNPKPPLSYRPALFIHLLEFYELRQIRVPDLDQVLSAVEFNNAYYSLFKVETDPEEVFKLVKKLGQRGDEILVGLSDQETYVCVLEFGATLA